MPVLQEKWITSPLTIIKDLFVNRGNDGGSSWGIKEFFEEKLTTDDNLYSVPSLNDVPLGWLRDGSLVRYRAMIQDQFDQEFYLKIYHNTGTKDTCCGIYSDLTHQSDMLDFDEPSNVIGDRQTLYCVPIPAETNYGIKGEKIGEVTKSTTQSQLKRKMDEIDNGDEEGVVPMEEGEGQGERFSTKKKRQDFGDVGTSHSNAHDLNFPLPGEIGLPCIVKVYDNFEEFRIARVVEMVGVLSVHPSLAPLAYSNHDNQQTMDTEAEMKVHSPPPSLVPRLHAITAKFLPHSNPLLPTILQYPLHPSIFPEYISVEGGVATCRSMVLDMLSEVLCGDKLAAEYTLLHIISSIYGRTDVLALGKFSLNLSQCCQPGISTALYHLLTNWLTKCFLLPLSLEHMNSWKFVPKKDYSSNRLISSVLQLSPGTQLLVDETALGPGQLTQVGVANLTALGNVIQWQKLSYDFQFHNTEFECDLPILVLSEGRSILKVDTHVPIVPATPHLAKPPSPQLINQMRRYLELCRGLKYNLTPQMKQELEEEFVRVRKSDSDTLNGETFHHLLSTARLVSLSHASSTLTPQLWIHTHTLNNARIQRLKT